jgi:hypothetical protein
MALENPAQVTPAVARKFQQKGLSSMAAVSNVPDVTGEKMAVRARHRLSPGARVSTQKNER